MAHGKPDVQLDPVAATQTDFAHSAAPEPHRSRTKDLLRRHPEIRALIGPSRVTFWYTVVIVALQFGVAWFVATQSWWLLVALAYTVGAFASHALFVVIHECAHRLVFPRKLPNILTGLLANLPLFTPGSVSFQKYHLKHHAFQGVYELDADVPSRWEARLIGRSAVRQGAVATVLSGVPDDPILSREGSRRLRPVDRDQPGDSDRGQRGRVSGPRDRRRSHTWPCRSFSRSVFIRWVPAGSSGTTSWMEERAGDVQLLRPAQRGDVQCRLPQRAPRFPVSALEPSAADPGGGPGGLRGPVQSHMSWTRLLFGSSSTETSPSIPA